MDIINMTPHPIVIRTDGGDITLPPTGAVPRVQTLDREAGTVAGVPLVVRSTGAVDGLPEPRPGVVVVTSAMVAQAAGGRTDVVAPDTGPTAVRDEQGRIVAVRRLVRYA